MVFSSPVFIFAFLPLCLGILAICPGIRSKNLALLVLSLAFYAWGESVYTLVILASIYINYLFGVLFLKNVSNIRRRDQLTWVFAAINILMLLYFKYLNFITENLAILAKSFGVQNFPVTKIHLPIGISFFTFQALSYVFDVSRGRVAPQRELGKMALYKALFPQLIAGPIVRYVEVEKELENRRVNFDSIYSGTQEFVIGLAKKVLIADTFGHIADQVFALKTEDLSFGLAWVGVLAYTIQIYFDFSGYSDMAIGLGRILGFTFPQNFNYPYSAKSITDYWFRWHISLTSWFRDYVFRPLCSTKYKSVRWLGEAWSERRMYIMIFVVFTLSGIWHGAAWTFVLWGMYHGVLRIFEEVYWSRRLAECPMIVQRGYTMMAVIFGWVLFRANDLAQTKTFLKAMAGRPHPEASGLVLPVQSLLTVDVLGLFVVACLASQESWLPFLRRTSDRIFTVRTSEALSGLAMLIFFLLSLSYLAAQTFNPFIYFRF